MHRDQVVASIEEAFRNQVSKDRNVKNAYLLVHSDRADVHLNLAEGTTGSMPADPRQPNYMASVGKLLTSTIVSMLHEQRVLSFDDRIAEHLDREITEGLHVHRGVDRTGEIQIRHLLNHRGNLASYCRLLHPRNPTQ